MSTLATVLWFAACALFWSCFDLAQVRAATGSTTFGALGALVLTLYAALGAFSGLAVAMAARRRDSERRPSGATIFALGFVGWAALFVGGYLNIVHLPSITDTVALAANAALAVAALAAWVALSRSWRLDRVAESAGAALAAALLLAGAGAAIAAAGRPSSRDPQRAAVAPEGAAAPSVFVVVVDTLRFDRTGAGGERSLTPAIDAIGREGATFRRAYAQSSWTKPSVASLFTALYPTTHRANLRRDRLSREPLTLPEMFAALGYRTAVFSANPWISPAFGFERGVDHFYESERETFARLVILLRVLKAGDRLLGSKAIAGSIADLEQLYGLRSDRRTNCERDEAIVGELEDWLAQGRGPAFAYLHLMSPHIPYDPPPEMDPYRGDRLLSNADQIALLQRTDALEGEKGERLRGLYDATVAHADGIVARLVDLLDRHAMLEHSILVVTADHGEEFHEHGRWGHGKSLYDELVRVPLVMRGPGVAAARTVEEPVMLVDVMPTLAKLAGASPQEAWEGTSVDSLVADRTAYAELIREGGFESYMGYRSGRKYLETTPALGQPSRPELYDLASDPGETKNLASREGDAPELAAAVAAMRERAGAKRVAGAQAVELDEGARERLNALGYVN